MKETDPVSVRLRLTRPAIEIDPSNPMGWALALHGGAGDIPRSLAPELRDRRLATLRDGSTALDVVELVVSRLTLSPRSSRLAFHTEKSDPCAGEGAGGLPVLQRRPRLRAHRRRHRRDGGLRHGGRHPALRRRLRPLHRRQRRLARQARHGQHAAHLPRVRRCRGLRQGTGAFVLLPTLSVTARRLLNHFAAPWDL
jgi:hypothetical protein